MHEFTFHAPSTPEEAVALLSSPDARALAGGTDLIPQVREGRRSPSAVIDLKRVPALTAFDRAADGGWRIGAATTIGALGRNELFAREHAALLAAARLIGSIQVQNRASLGGNICNAAPSADAVPLLICLGAEAEIVGPSSRRRIPVEAIAIGPGKTSLAAGELLVALHLPPRPARSAGHYLRFTPRREMDIAVAGAATTMTLDAGGTITTARVALASVAPIPLLSDNAAKVLLGNSPSAALFAATADAAANDARPISDSRGSADYRRHLVRVLTRRALDACARDLGLTTS